MQEIFPLGLQKNPTLLVLCSHTSHFLGFEKVGYFAREPQEMNAGSPHPQWEGIWGWGLWDVLRFIYLFSYLKVIYLFI